MTAHRRRAALALVVVAATAGCGAGPEVVAAGARATVPTVPPATLAPPSPTTVAPQIGAPTTTLPSSGAAAAHSPVFSVRGTSWPHKGPPIRVPLVQGGYRLRLVVSAELDIHTRQPYRCDMGVRLLSPAGTALADVAVRGTGMAAGTLVVAALTTAAVEPHGTVGCTWAMVIEPG